ncbi:MAG: ABC transporter permease [Thermomicrobiales bacterium]|nr:ABC transporter permease [Thermomicrobiales bacterium]
MTEIALQEQEEQGSVGIQEKSFLRRFVGMREFGILVAAIGLFAILSFLRPNTFFTEANFLRIAQSISILTIIATGMTFLFIAGELDLSVGTMHGLLAMFLSVAMYTHDIPPILAVPAAILLGMLLGAINGVITTFFGVPSFIVTLGMMSVFVGLQLTWVRVPPFPSREWKAEHAWFVKMMGARLWGTVPVQVFWMIGVVIVGSFVLSRTRFGYHVYATGSNAQAAANAGINTRRVKIACFMILGGLTGLASAVLIGWIGSTSRGYGQGYELDVIAAVVIGGTNLFGGVGSVLGTFLGGAITGMIRNGLVLLGAEQETIPIAMGVVIILAVVFDVTVRKRQRIG